MQVLSALLFVTHASTAQTPWYTWALPLIVLILIIVNSVWFSRLVSWLIFSGAFFCLLVLLSSFTIRWRAEPGFYPIPYYRAMAMYALFIYVSLAQIKILGGSQSK